MDEGRDGLRGDLRQWLGGIKIPVLRQVQGVWLYLEPIFSSEDIVKQMPTEAGKMSGNWVFDLQELVHSVQNENFAGHHLQAS